MRKVFVGINVSTVSIERRMRFQYPNEHNAE